MKKLKLVFYLVQHFCLFVYNLYKGRKIKRRIRRQNKKAGVKKV